MASSDTLADLPAQLSIRQEGDRLILNLAGVWNNAATLPETTELERQLAEPLREVVLCGEGLGVWNSRLPTFLLRIMASCQSRNIPCRTEELPGGLQRLLALAVAVPEAAAAGAKRGSDSLLARVGRSTLLWRRKSIENLTFFGEILFSLGRLMRGRARFRASDLLLHLYEAGIAALPIVTLISLLVGVILAFVGAVQLQMFGAELYIANAVGLGMARDMAAMMTGIIMAGRTGAAYAAQLGTMQVNEETDALRTFGMSPMDFLVLPRLLALTLMLPLLTIYANLMGILGGALVGIGMFDITTTQYYQQTVTGVPLHHFGAGLIKAGVYGGIVAISGCLRGMQCGRNAAAVGEATTSAVVTAITWIIVSCAILTVMFYVLDI